MRTVKSLGFILALSVFGCGGDANKAADAAAPDGAASCATALEEVECTHPLAEDLELDGQVMTCTGDLSIQARLTLTNGSRLESSGRFFIEEGGALITDGTPDCKIKITSAQDTPQAGDWTSMWFKSTADNSSMLTETIVEYGGPIRLDGGGSVGFDNTTVQHTAETALDLAGGTVTRFRSVSLNNITDVPVRIHPDDAAIIEPDISIDEATVQEPVVDVVAVSKNDMTVDGTWEDIGVPYRWFGDIQFEAELIIGEGASVWIAPSQRFFVANGGSIKAMGTSENPVEIRSANETGAPGDWKQIRFQTDAANDSLFQFTTIAHGGSEGQGALSLHPDATVTLENVTFADNETCDILDDGTVNTTGTTYTACP